MIHRYDVLSSTGVTMVSQLLSHWMRLMLTTADIIAWEHVGSTLRCCSVDSLSWSLGTGVTDPLEPLLAPDKLAHLGHLLGAALPGHLGHGHGHHLPERHLVIYLSCMLVSVTVMDTKLWLSSVPALCFSFNIHWLLPAEPALCCPLTDWTM